jgi:hypothetical protein
MKISVNKTHWMQEDNENFRQLVRLIACKKEMKIWDSQ